MSILVCASAYPRVYCWCHIHVTEFMVPEIGAVALTLSSRCCSVAWFECLQGQIRHLSMLLRPFLPCY